MYDVLIIGGGPGGIFAATISSLRNLDAIIIEGSSNLGGQPASIYPDKYIYDWPGNLKITGKELMDSFIEQISSQESHKPKVLLNTKVTEVMRKEGYFHIKLSNGHCIKALNIIIATGIGMYSSIKLDCEIDETSFYHVLYEFNKDKLLNKKHIVVLGGGDSALDWANHLVEEGICDNVSIIHRRDEWRAREEKINKLKENSINIYLNKTIKEIKDMKIIITDNVTQETEEIEFDKVLVQYGSTIDNNSVKQIFKNCSPESKVKFTVDINNKTTEDNIYAVGNAAEYFAAPNMILTSCADSTRAVYHIRKNKK